MSKDWFQKSIDSLSLNGKGERTQQAYTRALRMLVEFYGKAPQEISEAELEAYFLRRKNLDRWSANTLRICYCGIRFYFVPVLGRNFGLFNIPTSCALRTNRACPPCSAARRCAGSWAACTPLTTARSCPRYTPAGCGCRRRYTWKSPTSTAIA
jgi:hypothetical protein